MDNIQIRKLIKYRDRLLRKLNKNYSQNGEYLYKRYRNRVVSELRSSRVNYYKSRKICNISQLFQNGETVQNPKDIATILNKYFVNIAGKIDAEIPRTKKSPLDYLGGKIHSSFFFLLLTQLKLKISFLS